MTTTTRTPIEILDDVDRLVHLNATIALATAEADSIKRRLRTDYATDPGTHEVGGYRLSVTPARRFDEAAARTILASSPDLLASATVTPEPRLDAGRLRRLVAPAIYELCLVSGGDARVSIR